MAAVINKMYFPCCVSKSVSRENLQEDGGFGADEQSRVRRPNPLIIGLANHLREHHSSSRNSSMAGCFGFPDSPPKYTDIYVEARTIDNNPHSSRNQGGICNEGAKHIMADEEGSASPPQFQEDEVPPPSYEETMTMTMAITIQKKNLKQNFT